MSGSLSDRNHPDGSIPVSRAGQEHLHAALKQMDLLLASQDVEVCLNHLLAMLRHLSLIRRTMT